MDLIFAIQANDRDFFCQSNGRRRVPKGVPTMLRKTMIVLAKAAALTRGLTVSVWAWRWQRACVVRAADGCALSCLPGHRKPPLCSMGGCSRWDNAEASSIFG